MHAHYEESGYNAEQARRSRKMFASVALAVVSDAIREERGDPGRGVEQITRWARSRDGHTVLSCAGLEPGARVEARLAQIVASGEKIVMPGSHDEEPIAAE